MGITKIWAIKDSLSRVVGYAENAEKTEFSDMQQVLHYAQNGKKVISGPEKTMYDIRVLNLVNLEESDGYNPFRYLRDEKDVLKLVNKEELARAKRLSAERYRPGTVWE